MTATLLRYLVTGAPLRENDPGDNATMFHRATVDYRGRPYVRLTGPRWQRLARRNGAITVPALLTAASITPYVDLWMVGAYEGGLATAGVTWGAVATRRALRDRDRNREWVDPAAHKLANILKRRYVRRDARRLIHLPREWGSDHESGERLVARVYMYEGTVLSAAIKKSITENLAATFGIPHPITAEWAENNSFVDLSAAPVPPSKVAWDEAFQRAVDACTDDEVVVGRGPGGVFVKISLAEDSPHFAMSGAAGSGKSVLVRVVLRQRLKRGDGVFIFDPKRFSHMRWANQFGKGQVLYAVTDKELHDGWIAVGEEMRRRISLPLDELEQQRRVFLVAEEINAQIKILNRYWKEARQAIVRPARAALADAEKACGGSKTEGLAMALMDDPDIMAKLDPPVTSPAVVAMQESVFMGRELRMHVIAAAQRLSAGVFGGGGGDVRESFQGGRFMAKWDRKLWKMLADGIPYVAWPGGARGVWGLAKGEEMAIFRVPWMAEPDMATVAIDGHGPVLGPPSGHVRLDKPERVAIATGVTLATAVGQLPRRADGTERNLASLQKASQRPGFPVAIGQEGVAKLYDLAELEAWAAR